MSDSPDLSTHAQKILRNGERFVQHVRAPAAQGSFYLDTIHTNEGRGPFVAEWALYGPSGVPRVRLVCGSCYALVVPIHMRHMPSTMAHAFAEMLGIATRLASQFDEVDCGGTVAEMVVALAAGAPPGTTLPLPPKSPTITDEEAFVLVRELADFLPRCVICDLPATRRKQGTLFVKPDFGCDQHMPGAEEVKWAALARLVDGIYRRVQPTTPATPAPITDEAVLDLYQGIRAELPEEESVSLGELLADMRHANLGASREERIKHLTAMERRGALFYGGGIVWTVSTTPPVRAD